MWSFTVRVSSLYSSGGSLDTRADDPDQLVWWTVEIIGEPVPHKKT